VNSSFHYHSTAAIVAEALIARGVDKAHSAITAILVARSNAMVDHWTQKHATEDCPATQIDPEDPAVAAMIASGHMYPLFERCHGWHFDHRNGWGCMPSQMEIENVLSGKHPTMNDFLWMQYGVHLHTAQDTDSPHAGYSGFPSKANYALARKRLRERGERLPFWAHLFGKGIAVGHMHDKDADKIANCRDGAVKSAVRLYELVSGFIPNPDACHYWSIYAIQQAADDHDLAARQRSYFKNFITGQELPEFVPMAGEELKTWCEVVR